MFMARTSERLTAEAYTRASVEDYLRAVAEERTRLELAIAEQQRRRDAATQLLERLNSVAALPEADTAPSTSPEPCASSEPSETSASSEPAPTTAPSPAAEPSPTIATASLPARSRPEPSAPVADQRPSSGAPMADDQGVPVASGE